jgi:hypothetical protein
MKIVETDNFGGDYPDESFLNIGSIPEGAAEEIAEVINKHLCGDGARRFWKVVEDDYVLQPGFEP